MNSMMLIKHRWITRIALLVNADNAIDMAHARKHRFPFLACMVDDCIKRGKTLEQGGAVYNFTGPQGFSVANMAMHFTQ